MGFAAMILALALMSFGATSLSGSSSASEAEVAEKVFSSSSGSLLAFVDSPLDSAEDAASTTSTPRRSGRGTNGSGGYIETTTTTVVLSDLDHEHISAFRSSVEGLMADVATISDRTIYNLGTGLCEVAQDVESAAGFATMTGLIWVGLEVDSRATYYNDSDNFLASSTSAISVFCPELTPTQRP